jgi:lipopolysaccharide transport system ATP-binding protein
VREMSDVIIAVDNLGKRYQLGQRSNERYIALRDVLTDCAKSLFRRDGRKKLAPDLRLNSVRASHNEIWALRDVSFEVKKGEVVGIIGRNGAGKTTLLKILSRITEPTTGKVRIKGRVASLLEVGTGFHPELTGRENIFLNGAILGMTRPEIQKKFDEIVAFAEIEKFLDTPVKRYSSGMYVRLAFAVAAHLEPEILVVDEVLAVGDAEFQKKCLGKMNEVSQRQGRTVLFVSHQMNAVERLCSRALLIDKGRLQMESQDVRSITRFYLSGGETFPAQSEWRNAGNQFTNPWFQPQHLFLADASGVPLRMPVTVNSEIWFYIVAEFKMLDPALVIGYAIYAESGELLYLSCQTDGREEEWPRLRLGKAVLRGRIPPRLLNEGTYRLDLIAGLHNRQRLFKEGGGGPSVFLDLRGGLSDSPLRNKKRRGLLAPVVAWELCEEG